MGVDIGSKVLNKGTATTMETDYWLKKLAGEFEKSFFPHDSSKNSMYEYKNGSFEFNIQEDIGRSLIHQSNGSDIRLYAILVAALMILINKYIDTKDIIIGSPTIKQLVGSKNGNTILPLRITIEQDMTYKELLTQTRQAIIEANQNQNCQMQSIAKHLSLANNDIFSLFDIMVNVNNIQSTEKNINNMTFSFLKEQRQVRGIINYNSLLYEGRTIERIAGYYKNIIKIISSNWDIKLEDIEVLQKQERKRLLYDFNKTQREYPMSKAIHELFEEQVRKTPNNIALVAENISVTYEELNHRANCIASLLRNKGVGREKIVAIMVERSIEMVAGIIGILKSGGAYLPVDPVYPADRISYMLQDSDAVVMLTQNHLANKVDLGQEVIIINDNNLYSRYCENIKNINNSRDLAYVIYTSGSTGLPKGVMVEHRSVINILTELQLMYPLSEKDTYLLKTTYTFDVSVAELFGWFHEGGRLAILSSGDEKEPAKIVEAIDKFDVTHINFAPSILRGFLDLLEKKSMRRLKSLKYVFAAGEVLPVQIATQFYETIDGVKLENIYGPTESTIYAIGYTVRNHFEYANIPIGKPLGNMCAYILDAHKNPKPLGAVGELYLSGVGLARGYLNKPELTSEKFVVNPFVECEKMYRTGDLARWITDGNIEYFGRVDFQVKVRGYRIELGEIEKNLLNFSGIRECMVISKKNSFGETYLVGYYSAEEEISVSILQSHLGKKLPPYMVPGMYVRLKSFPLTSSGKVDRNALPEPGGMRPKLETNYLIPATEIEEVLVDIWKKILNVDAIGVNDKFLELGGNSLLIVLMHGEVEKRYPGKVQVADLFSYSTISKLAKFIENPDVNTECEAELPFIMFPRKYFNTDGEIPNNSACYFKIETIVYSKLKQTSFNRGLEVKDILTSIFAYLLHQITGSSEIRLHVIDFENKVIALNLNMDDINDILSLYRLTANRLIEERKCAFSLDSIERLNIKKKDGFITSLVCIDADISNDLATKYDITLKISEGTDGIIFVCEYDGNRLKESVVEKLVSSYVYLLTVLLEG